MASSTEMARTVRDYLWILAFAVLIAFAVPWFLWRDATVVAGLPVWLWWHVGWMALAALVFHAFTRSAWDRGMAIGTDRAAESTGSTPAEGTPGPNAADAEVHDD